MKYILHVLRNPYGYSREEVRDVRLEAADLIEDLFKAKDEISWHKINSR